MPAEPPARSLHWFWRNLRLYETGKSFAIGEGRALLAPTPVNLIVCCPYDHRERFAIRQDTPGRELSGGLLDHPSGAPAADPRFLQFRPHRRRHRRSSLACGG
ncbi:hypothetical protein BRAS3843_10023 [Bradyrhizobium sp. STM 3843]|nr:hypothetical protein BRAS3843_10023 [Bradyrhizobium sp. STM 3843]